MFLLLDILRMVRDIGQASRTVYIWGALLNLPQLVGGLIFIMAPEGLVILATLIITQVAAGQIHRRMPFSRLVGLCHLPWLAMLPWLLYRLKIEEHSGYFQMWGYYVAITVAISLIFDTMDVYRYTKGNKTFSWAS